MLRRPWIADQTTEVIVGGALVVLGMALLWDAYDGRGQKKPLLLGPILPW